jgi:hypothetical protein
VITIPSAAVYKTHYALYAVGGYFNTTVTARCRQHTAAGKSPLPAKHCCRQYHRRQQRSVAVINTASSKTSAQLSLAAYSTAAV